MSEDDLDKATQVLALVSKAPMSDRVRRSFEKLARDGDWSGMVKYLERCVRTQREVGRSVERAGLASFESILPEIRRICGS